MLNDLESEEVNMSTNSKNKIRECYFKNYTKKRKNREILVESSRALNGDIQEIVNEINLTVNQIIQELNLLIHDRQLPYITLDIKYKPEIEKRARMVLIERDTQEEFENNIKRSTAAIGQDVSHFIEILSADGFKEVVISPLGCNSEIVIGKDYITYVIVDILLDIVMFNSYSFLKNMTIAEKHEFCNKKYNYFKKENLNCFYEYKEEDESKELYYAISFSARNEINSFDTKKYIKLWSEFINAYFPDSVHVEKTISEQLKQHIDYCDLPKNLSSKFAKEEKGAHLLLRVNKDVTESYHEDILNLFKMKKYRIGKVKIVPISDFNRYEYLFRHLDVSVFKIVKV